MQEKFNNLIATLKSVGAKVEKPKLDESMTIITFTIAGTRRVDFTLYLNPEEDVVIVNAIYLLSGDFSELNDPETPKEDRIVSHGKVNVFTKWSKLIHVLSKLTRLQL